MVTLVKKNALDQLVPVLEQVGLQAGACTVVADSITYDVAGVRVAGVLSSAGWEVDRSLLDASPTGVLPHVRADERSAGSLLLDLSRDAELLVAVGSGTVTDVTRFIGSRTGRPFISVPTAPSVDAYTSGTSPMTRLGLKETVWGTQAHAVIADTGVLGTAPQEMRAAGFGDTVGKIIARADWSLAHMVDGEYFCPDIVDVVRSSVDGVIKRITEVGAGEPDGIAILMESLSISGAAMAMTGDSRPAAGSEHLVSHYMEMHAAQHGRPEHLHGTAVGIGTVLMAHFWKCFAKRLAVTDPSSIDPKRSASQRRTADEVLSSLTCEFGPGAETVFGKNTRTRLGNPRACANRVERVRSMWTEIQDIAAGVPSPEDIAGWLHSAGAPAYPSEIGMGQSDVMNTIIGSNEVRVRTTVTTVAEDLGWLISLADEVAGNVS